jgi:murein DD-endopeptidase MepM/ murein hydrolase activator NlpD
MENDVYTSFSDTEVARSLASQEGMGLRRIIEKALEKSAGKTADAGLIKALESNTVKPFTAGPAKTSGAIPAAENHTHEFGAPAHGVVSSRFGQRADPFTGESRFHKGLDIAAPLGSAITAAAAGKVVFSGWAEGYGNLVTVDHGDGILTRYAHTAANLVHAGDDVAAGQEIALVGSTGRSTAPHLHFEVHKNGQPIDPMQIVGFARVSTGGRKG